jgi:hypothetical protein
MVQVQPYGGGDSYGYNGSVGLYGFYMILYDYTGNNVGEYWFVSRISTKLEAYGDVGPSAFDGSLHIYDGNKLILTEYASNSYNPIAGVVTCVEVQIYYIKA